MTKTENDNPFLGFVTAREPETITTAKPPKQKVIALDDTIVTITAQIRKKNRSRAHEISDQTETPLQEYINDLILNNTLEKQPVIQQFSHVIPEEELLVNLSARVQRKTRKRLREEARKLGVTMQLYLDALIEQDWHARQ